MRFFGALRTLGLVLACGSGACVENDPEPTPPTPWAMDTGAVIAAPGSDAGATGNAGGPAMDASFPVLDSALPAAEGGAQGLDAALPQRDATAASPESGAADGAPAATDAGTEAATPGGDDAMPGTVAIPAPVADDCISNVNPGDHTFTCQGGEGVEFQVMVDPRCTKFACGLIFDVHGAFMSGQDMRDNTRLHELAPSKGYLVVHPSALDLTWDWQTHPQVLKDFMTRMIKAFHVDTKRVHMTGFSMGAGMTFWFLCNHTAALASTAPVTGSSASQVMVVGSGAPCIESIDSSWRPRVPILFMSGTQDSALSIDVARERTNGIVTRLGLTGGQQIDGDDTFTRKRWTGAEGMMFDFLEHNYTNTLLAGHCIPGGVGGLFGCDSGGSTLKWGPVVLQWFIEHPQP
jgi:poly(3-hydroxybutyrate) depolymerase